MRGWGRDGEWYCEERKGQWTSVQGYGGEWKHTSDAEREGNKPHL